MCSFEKGTPPQRQSSAYVVKFKHSVEIATNKIVLFFVLPISTRLDA